MFFKKIIQKNIKPILILGIVFCFYILNVNNTFADDITLGGNTYTVGSYTDFETTGISDPVGVIPASGDSTQIQSIVLADTGGNKVQLHFNSKGLVDEILDEKNKTVYSSNSGAAVGTADLQTTLGDLGKKIGYSGDLAKDVNTQRNTYYNNQLIAQLQSNQTCTSRKAVFDGAIDKEVEGAGYNGHISTTDADAIKNAMSTGTGWTPDLATKLKGALNNNLGAVDTYFYYGAAQEAIQCAYISAATQGDKDKAIATLQQLNKTGGSINSLTSDQLNNLVKTTNAGVTAGGGVGSATQVAQDVSGAANKPAQDDANEKLKQCAAFTFTNGFSIDIAACLAEIFYFILSILAFFLGIVGLFFNLVFEVTLVNMKANINTIGVVTAGWVTIRDMANILFIFMLLYLAISTILQRDEHGIKHGLSRLIVGAVLINFSLFFVKIPIDISNILAVEIYDKIIVNGHDNIENDGSAGLSFGLGDAILAMFSPQQVFDNSSLDPKTLAQASTNGTTNNVGQLSAGDPAGIGWNLQKNPLTTFAMGIIVMFTSIFIFLAVCIIFIKRFITLVMLMIFSPLAFAGMAIPNHSIEHEISEKFWSTLFKESFYAPAFMFIIYLTIMTGEKINAVGGQLTGGSANFGVVPVTNVISYSVVLGMMIFALTVSETIGVKGAGSAIKFFDGARGMASEWATKNTIGRLAYTRANKGQSAADLARDASGQRGLTRQVLARSQLAVLKNLGKGFGEKVHLQEEYKKGYDEEMHNDPNTRAEILMNNINNDGTVNALSSGLQANDKLAHHYNAEENANIKLALEKTKRKAEETIANSKDADEIKNAKITLNKATGALERYYTGNHAKGIHARLTPEMANKVARAEFGELDHYNDEFREILNDHAPAADIANNIKAFIQNAKSEAAVVGALKSAGEAMSKMKGNTPDAQILKQSLSDALRDKFNGEAAYANIAKDPIIDKEVRAAISAGGFYAKMTADLYDSLQDPANTGDKAKMEVEFKKLLGKINNKEIENAIATNNLAAMLKAYKDNKLGDDRPTQNFFTKDNGNRSQTQSADIIAELENLANMGVVIKSK